MAEQIFINEEQPTLTINEIKAGANENEILVDVSLDQASDLSVSTSFLLIVNNESESASEKVSGNISFEKGETSKTIVIKLSSASSSMDDVSISLHSPQNTNLISRSESISSDLSSTTNQAISSSLSLRSSEVSKVYFFNLQDTSQNIFQPTESIVDTLVNLPLSRKEKRAARRLQKTLKEGDIDNQDIQDNLTTTQQDDLKINEAPNNLGNSQSTDSAVSVSNAKSNRAARRLARALRRAERASKNEINETNNELTQDNNQGKASVMTLMVTRDSQEVLPSTDFTTAARTETVSSLGMSQMMQMDLRLSEKTVKVKHVKPTISIDDVTSTDETGSQVFTVTLNKVTTGTIFVDYTTVDITAQEDTDYTPVTGTLTFTPGTVSQTITVPIIEDTLDEMGETLKVVLSDAVGGKIKDNTGEMTITDDDGISVSPNNVTVTEAASNSTITMTMVLGQPSENDVTVDWATSDRDCGCATNAYAGLDYTAASGTVTFLAGETSQTFTIPLLADVLHETTEKFNIDLSNPTGGAIIDVERATVTIVDNDDPPTLSINNVTQAEDAGNATFTVTLSEVSGRATKVTYNVPSDTATSGDDFTATSGILTIPAGNLTGTIIVPVINDTADEDNETATVTLSSPEGATINDGSGTLTITDDDDEPTLSIDDVTFNETTGNGTLTVTLSAISGKDITVDYATSNGTATAGSDYTAGTGTITIPAGSTSTTIDVAVIGDSVDEPNETINVTLDNPTNASINGDPTGVLTIADDDATPSLSINDVSYTESGSAGNATFTVTLSAASSKEVTVNYASSNATATAGSDYTAASGTVTIAAGATSATFNVPVLADTLAESSETATLTLSNASNATISDATGTLTIVDDDTAPTISIGDVTFTETTGNATLTVTLSKVSGQDVTVDYATSNGTATAGTDYTAGTGTVTIPAGSTTATFNVGVTGDSLDEANETINVTISNPTGATISDNTGVVTINDDDDAPSLSINDVSYTESGSAGNATFTVTLSAASGKDVEVDYASSNGTAAAGSDYTAASGTVTILAGNTTQTFNVPVLVDTLDESSETATLTLSNASNATISDATGTLTIVDDDATPSLSINDVSYTESGSAGNATFTVTLSAASGQDVEVDYASSNATAAAGSDYTAASGTVTIAAGATSATFNVPVLVDTLDESSETATLTLSNASNASISDATGTLTIVDDDATPTLSVADKSLNEDDVTTQVTISLSHASSSNITFDWTTSADTATGGGTDFTNNSGTATISAGNTSVTVDVGIIEDSVNEDNETFNVIISNPSSGATIADNTGVITIIDDESVPTVGFASSTSSNAESTSSAAIAVNLSTSSSSTITVNYTVSGTATGSGTDYTLANGAITFAAGETSKNITIASIISDALDEPNETVILTLSDPTNASLGTIEHTYTITDDDNEPSLSINDVSYTESGSAGNATFTVTLSAASGKDVEVDYASSNGTATAGSDYTAASGTVTIAAGATSATFNVPVLVDTLDEANETATLTLSNASNATISDATGTLTIVDDDNEPSLSINDVSYTESGSAGNATFTVTLSAASGKDVEVDYASSNGTAAAGSDYTAASGTVTIAAGATSATFNVPVLVDTLDESSETATLTLSNASNATISDATGTLTIVDDDATPSLSINDVSYTESGSAGNATFTVTLSAASSKEVTVNYASSNATAAAGSDYTAASGTVTIAAGATSATFNVPVLVDTLDEASETATLTLSSATNATISDATGTLTIVDEDTAPSLSINDVSYTESGSAGNATFTVTLSAASGQDVEVDYASSNGTATAGSDYTAASGTVTILAGNTTQTFNVPVLVDTLDEANETATLTLSNASNATISDATGTLTIVDDDSAPSISINNNAMTENAANLSFTVSLSTASSKEITVNYATANNTATAGADYTAVSATTLTFDAGQTSKTVNVGILEDTVDEDNETFYVNLTSPSNATISDAQAIGTIYDDDVTEVQPSLTINNVAVTENAGSMTFTVTASGTYSEDVTFNYATANGSASSSSDYTSTSGTGTITAGNTTTTITVNVTNDSVYESTEVLYVNLSSPTNATISDSQGSGTIYNDDAQCDADGITYVSNVVVDNSASNFRSEQNAGSSRSNDHPNDRFIITSEQVDSQWSGTSSQTFDTYTGYSGKNNIYNNIVYGKNKAGNSQTTNVQNGDYFNSYLIYLNNSINRRTSGSGTIRFEHNIMGMYFGHDDTTSNPSIMTQFEKSGATYASLSDGSAGNRSFENTGGGDWIRITTSGTYAYKEITVGAKNGRDGDFIRVITNSCLTDGIVVGVEYTTSSGLKGLTDHEGNFSHYVGDDVTFNIGGVVLGTATAEDLAEGRVFLQDIADVDRTTLNGTYLENMATFLQSLDDNNDAYDNIVISQAIREALVHESLDLRTASEEEVEQLINKVGGIWVEEEDAMTHVKDMLIKYSDLTEADFEDTASPSSRDVLVDVIDTDLLVDEYKASDNASALEEPVLAGVDESTIDLSDLLDVPGDEIDSLIEENDPNDEPADKASVDQTGEGEDVAIDGSAVAPFELVDSLLGEVTTPVEV